MIKKKIISWKIVVPFMVFILLVLFLVVFIHLVNTPPVIEKLKPSVALPGQKIEITGRHFGKKMEDGEVIIAGIRPTISDYISWSDVKIVLKVPEDVSSGRLYVKTKYGLSNGPLFTNREFVPVINEGPSKPGEPYIQNVSPSKGAVGQKVTIGGLNFGFSRGESKVLFSFYSGNDTTGPSYVSCSSLDFDYASWNSQKVVVYVPDGATSGELKMVTDRGESNSVYFEVINPVGTKFYGQKKGYQIQYDVTISDIVSSGKDTELDLWVPGVLHSLAQRNIQVVFDPKPVWENYKGLMMYQIKSVEPWRSYKFTQTYWLERYPIETNISEGRVNKKYDKSRELYKYYTGENQYTPVNDKKIHDIAYSVTRRESNPLKKEEKIYNYILKRLEYDKKAAFKPVESIDKRKGDSYDYAILFTALSRSAGVPARTVAGYIVFGNKQTRKHWWAEFFLDGFGWVPVDPALGDGMDIVGLKVQDNAKKYYFGNIDNKRIAFSKGIVEIEPINPGGKTVSKQRSYSLQTINEEYSDSIESYKSRWNKIQVIDWW